MRSVLTPIPAGSEEIAIWHDLPPGPDTGEPIDLVCNLWRLSPTECAVTKAKGEMTDAANIEIGIRAYQQGYQRLHFTVAHGHKPSHWAQFVKTENGMDHYLVELGPAIQRYRQIARELGIEV